jgi:hypothetical protein
MFIGCVPSHRRKEAGDKDLLYLLLEFRNYAAIGKG